jgi:hypothetical protein
MSLKKIDCEFEELTKEIQNRVLAVLMAEHPRLGALSIIPQDVAVMIAELVYWKETIVSYMNNMSKIKFHINFLVAYPHSVLSVMEGMQVSLNDELHEVAEAYALNLYKTTHSGREPQRLTSVTCHYSNDDFWIVQAAVNFARKMQSIV